MNKCCLILTTVSAYSMSPHCIDSWLECGISLESTVMPLKSQKNGMTIEDSSHHPHTRKESCTFL